MKRKKILYAVSFLTLFCLFAPALYAQEQEEGQQQEEMSAEQKKKIKEAIEKHRKKTDETRHKKISSVLTDLGDEYKKGGEGAAREFAKKRGINSNGKSVSVEIFLKKGITTDIFDKTRLETYGCNTEMPSFKSGQIHADCPIDKLIEIADGIEEIDLITPFISMAIPLSYRSEGLNKVGFSNYSAASINGSGVKVAVIDLGFKGLSSAISNGDLPNNVIQVDCTA